MEYILQELRVFDYSKAGKQLEPQFQFCRFT
jgi:hypothetical protein